MDDELDRAEDGSSARRYFELSELMLSGLEVTNVLSHELHSKNLKPGSQHRFQEPTTFRRTQPSR